MKNTSSLGKQGFSLLEILMAIVAVGIVCMLGHAVFSAWESPEAVTQEKAETVEKVLTDPSAMGAFVQENWMVLLVGAILFLTLSWVFNASKAAGHRAAEEAYQKRRRRELEAEGATGEL